MLEHGHMANTTFIAQEKREDNRADSAPIPRPGETHFKLVDGALIIGFLSVFVGLILLLAK